MAVIKEWIGEIVADFIEHPYRYLPPKWFWSVMVLFVFLAMLVVGVLWCTT